MDYLTTWLKWYVSAVQISIIMQIVSLIWYFWHVVEHFCDQWNIFPQLDNLQLTSCWQWRLGLVNFLVRRRLIDRLPIACWTGQVLRMQTWKAMVIIYEAMVIIYDCSGGLGQHSARNPKCNESSHRHHHHLFVFRLGWVFLWWSFLHLLYLPVIISDIYLCFFLIFLVVIYL